VRELLDELGAVTPAPGGGSAAAWAAALAAALVEMAAGFADDEDSRARAHALRDQALALAEEERGTYGRVLDARRRGDEGAAADALSQAADPPLAIARVGAEVAELGAAVARAGKEALKGDALTGVELAGAACRAAARLVEINLADTPQDPRLAEAAELRRGSGGALRPHSR
jgi:methenyltetrahydrofolate cyclohydrolase